MIFKRVTFRTIRILAGVGTTVVFGMNTIPHIFPSTSVERRHGHPCFSKRYKKMLKEVCSQMKINSNKVELFYNNGFGTVSGGCLHLPQQSVIGLPQNCMFATIKDVRYATILFQENSIDWNSKIGKALEEVLLISDKHVKFLIAHELVHIKDMDFIPSTLHATGFCLGAYKASMLVASYYKGLVAYTIFGQIIVCGIAFLFFKVSQRQLSHWMEYKADKSAATLGLEYSDGGIDCMNSRLKLNLVLREMDGERGEKMFSKVGDNLSNMLSTHPSKIERLRRIEEIRKKFDVSTYSVT